MLAAPAHFGVPRSRPAVYSSARPHGRPAPTVFLRSATVFPSSLSRAAAAGCDFVGPRCEPTLLGPIRFALRAPPCWFDHLCRWRPDHGFNRPISSPESARFPAAERPPALDAIRARQNSKHTSSYWHTPTCTCMHAFGLAYTTGTHEICTCAQILVYMVQCTLAHRWCASHAIVTIETAKLSLSSIRARPKVLLKSFELLGFTPLEPPPRLLSRAVGHRASGPISVQSMCPSACSVTDKHKSCMPGARIYVYISFVTSMNWSSRLARGSK